MYRIRQSFSCYINIPNQYINKKGPWRTTITTTTPCSPQTACSTPAPPAQLVAPLVQPVAPPVQPATWPVQPCPIPQLNWSHLKLEFAGKPEEDAEAHLLGTNDWMDTHAFPEGVKVQRFSLTLVGETRLWYKSLRPIALDWNCLQTQFIQQYSEMGNRGKQLFHAWRSFHFDENSETLDSYVTCIRQVALLWGYGKPQVLEVF